MKIVFLNVMQVHVELSFSPCAGPVHHSDLACVWLKVTVHIKHVSKGSTAN